jgi:hypothetical protein
MRKTTWAALAGSLAILACAPRSSATVIIKDPNPPAYKLEIEPHLNVQYFYTDAFGGHGLGPGVRFGIPIVSPGFIKKLNNSVAISFGPDLLRFSPQTKACNRDGCFEGDAFWALYFPVTMQWNFWITDKWSVFGEPGVVARTPFGDCDRGFGCRKNQPIWFGFYAGARWHFGETTALTIRLGYPQGVSVGVSFF